MTKQSENVAHSELVDGSTTSLHSHAGGSGGGLVVSGATVFSGTAPTSWTDLDLSSVVGANQALVMLQITATSDRNALAVRTNGDTEEYYNPSSDASAHGLALVHHDSSNAVVVMCITDSSGVIEWRVETVGTTTIKLMAYIM